MIVLCTLVYVCYALFDVIPLVKNKQWKVLAVYSVLIVTAFIFTILTELGFQIPSPAVPLKQLITSIVGK